MRISTEIRNRRMMGFLLKGKTPKEVARKFNLSVWAVYKAQKEMGSTEPRRSAETLERLRDRIAGEKV